MHRLIFDLIEAGVPANELTVEGITVFDNFIQAISFYVLRLQDETRSMGLKMLQDLLTSVSYMSSWNLALNRKRSIGANIQNVNELYTYENTVYDTTQIAREIVINNSFEG
jgi:hypothetical protein